MAKAITDLDERKMQDWEMKLQAAELRPRY
jgi:hypothetical protein